MKPLQGKNKERGTVLVWTVVFLTAGLGMVAMAVDLSFAYVVSNELKSVSDAGSLTAASRYVQELRDAMNEDGDLTGLDAEDVKAEVRDNVNAIIGRSRVLNQASVGDVNFDLQFGTYTFDDRPFDGTQFLDQTDALIGGDVAFEEITAFRVVSRRGDADDNRLSYQFGRIFGIENFQLERESIAVLAPRNFMLVMDTSASMDNLSYPRPENPDLSLPWNAEESFIVFPPFAGMADTPWYSPYAPGPTDRYIGYEDEIMPQPLQVVLDSSLNFLQDLSARANLGDLAGVNYFAEASDSKVPLTPISQDAVDGVYTDLLLNRTLYDNLIKPATTPAEPYFVLPTSISAFDFTNGQYDGPVAIPNGRTNIGDAIDLAVSDINDSTLNVAQSISVIILFTDGRPTCAPSGSGFTGAAVCFSDADATAAQLQQAREYTFFRATEAIEQGILVYPISYGALDPETVTLLDEIALLSGLTEGHFRVGTSTDLNEIQDTLDTIFDNIATLIPFVLVA